MSAPRRAIPARACGGRGGYRRRWLCPRWLAFATGCAVAMAMLALPALANAADYATSTSTGNAIVPGATDVGNHCDDCTTAISLPFVASLYGTSFTSAVLSPNGNVQFTGNTGDFDSGCSPLPNSTFGTTIFAYQDDLRTDGISGGIFTATTGSAPNRQFIIEWRTTYFGQAGTANFALILNEGSPNFSVIYGATADDGSGETTGVQQDGAPGSAFTQFSCATASTPSGLRVDYTLGGDRKRHV